MEEITSLTSMTKLASQSRVSMGKVAAETAVPLDVTPEIGEWHQIETKMEALDHAFNLVREIRSSLEQALEKLSSQE